jgi:predicted transcriptional regulator
MGAIAMTTMKVPVEVRDRLMALARGHDRTLGAELTALVEEAEEREWWRNAKQAAARLRADREQWDDYLREADAWEAGAADGLGEAAAEWPEYNKDHS